MSNKNIKDYPYQNTTNFDEKNSKIDSATQLFEKTSIFKALLKVIFLAIIVSLSIGIYVFVDQILMVKIIPLNTKYFSESHVFNGTNYDYNTVVQIVKENNIKINVQIAELVRTSISLSSPLTLVCNALALLLGLGISINFSKFLGKKDYLQLDKTWSNGFYLTLLFSIVSSLVIMILSYFIINVESKPTDIDLIIPSNTNISNEQKLQLTNFLNHSRKITIDWAIEYTLILVGFNILNAYTTLFISLLNSEGKNGIPTIFMLIANVFNIILDFVLLRYTSLGIMGAAIATVISWAISTTIFVSYITYLNKKQQTLLDFKKLKVGKLKFDKTIIILIFAIGISSFLRNASSAVFSTVQQSIYGSITSVVSDKENTYYLTLLGAINPIYNLFFSAILGIIRGARTVITYNYGKNNVENIKKAFWISIVMAVSYALAFFVLVCFALPNQFFWLFNIFRDQKNYADAYFLLLSNMGQLPLFGFTISGMLYFQSTNKPLWATISSIFPAIIVGIPTLFIAAEIAKHTMNINYFVYCPLIIMLISSICVCGFSFWYVFFKKDKKSLNATIL